MRNGLEWFRLVTPLLVTINLFLMTQLYFQMSELNQRLFQHMTNSEMHVPRAEFLVIQNQLERTREEILEMIKQQLTSKKP